MQEEKKEKKPVLSDVQQKEIIACALDLLQNTLVGSYYSNWKSEIHLHSTYSPAPQRKNMLGGSVSAGDYGFPTAVAVVTFQAGNGYMIMCECECACEYENLCTVGGKS